MKNKRLTQSHLIRKIKWMLFGKTNPSCPQNKIYWLIVDPSDDIWFNDVYETEEEAIDSNFSVSSWKKQQDKGWRVCAFRFVQVPSSDLRKEV